MVRMSKRASTLPARRTCTWTAIAPDLAKFADIGATLGKTSMERAVEGVVLFADVSGSTRLYESAGDAMAAAAIERCLQLFKEKTEEAGGRVIKTIGDAVMSVFANANAAAGAAIEIQVGLDALDPLAGTKLGARIGFHSGPAVERDGDLFGDTVNLASRLTDMASKGQIITSLETVSTVNPVLREICRPLYSIPVKGKVQEVSICELLWRSGDAATTLMAGRTASAARLATLRLRYRDQEVILGAGCDPLTLGRDKSAGLQIEDPMASRSHGRIERRTDKFVLVDHSANGSYVTVEGDLEVVLRREEFVLRRRGWIAFGQSRNTTSEVLEFVCE